MYFSGFCFKNEELLFEDTLSGKRFDACFIKDEFSISGFSYGAQKALLLTIANLRAKRRVTSLNLISPAFFTTKDEIFKKMQIYLFKQNSIKYIDTFLQNAGLFKKQVEDLSSLNKNAKTTKKDLNKKQKAKKDKLAMLKQDKSLQDSFKYYYLQKENELVFMDDFLDFSNLDLKQEDLKTLLSFNWTSHLKELENLRELHNLKLDLRIFIGGADRIIDADLALDFFKDYGICFFLKDKNHFLY